MAPAERLSPRERVRPALDHRDTDRVPIAMVCSGINEPARTVFDRLLRRERGTDVDAFLGGVPGRQGGYILGPAHVIQAGTPPDNTLAMFDAALAPRP